MSLKFKGAHASVLLSLCLGCNVAGAIAQTPAPPAAADSASPSPTTAPSPLPPSGDATPAKPLEETIAPVAASTDAGPCCTLPDGSPVQLEVVGAISSKTALRGQTFGLRLAQPLSTAEGVLLPAGIEGTGEVIHAERSRGGGKAGELILAARHLQGPAGPIKLRGMKLGGSGSDKTGAAIGASLILPLGGFVRGTEIEIPAGTPANAKLAGAIHLPPIPAAAPDMDTAGAPPAPAASEDAPTPSSPTPAPTPL